MRFVIVTGVSGAGKSTALKMLEDANYFCVDNLPIPLIEKFVSLTYGMNTQEIHNVALGVDVRSGQALDELEYVLDNMEKQGYQFEILFLDANDQVLIKRYKETRRTHPLAAGGRVDTGIRLEREKLQFLRTRADYIIDTSNLLTRELRSEIGRIFVENQDFANLMISILSFGFKYGIPSDSDLVFDVRCLPNPYYIDELRPLTGEDEAVYNYVMSGQVSKTLADKLQDLIAFLIPQYVQEGKTNLVIAVGCTGGKHRSVAIARELYQRLSGNEKYGIRLEHRDIQKDISGKG
ncbi:MAG TPA: RNase adapter RapZ [Candidatus Blautia gallistercoris]|uniref:RNase adapter RapZ n=1 Tax=Candidatus Blautia gallistercoris TaxID=2838490 RepID=A0A9D1WLK7_9FIRM|nr:RNase adapter RapZ [Candidatus Blautia gallistercoris]